MVYDIYTPTKHIRLTDEIVFRTYTWPQFQRLLRKVPAFEIAAVHDFAYNLNTETRISATTEDVVFVLRAR
jgi:hypothetical protein